MKESQTVEFKQEISRTFLKTVSSFANFGEGEVLFGIDDSGVPMGMDNPTEACLIIENYINANIKPMPRYTLETRSVQGRDIVALRVFEGRDKPYYYHGKAYRRNDTADVEVDRIELNRLVLEGQNLSFEKVQSSSQNLSFETLAHEFDERAGIAPVDEKTLKTLNLRSDDEGYNNAAAILADANEFAGVDIVRFGNDESEILDRERHIGVSALSQLQAALAMYRKYYQYEKIEGAYREKRSLVPEEAFREAVANALVHRQWDSPVSVQIGFYQEGIRVVSPGGLPVGITFDEYLEGRVSVLRNPILGNVFYRLNYIEMFGTGVARIQSAYSEMPDKPTFRATDNFLIVELPVVSRRPGLTGEEEAVIKVFLGGRLLSRGEVEEATGLSKSKAGRLLNALVDRGYLFREGSGRATRYGREHKTSDGK